MTHTFVNSYLFSFCIMDKNDIHFMQEALKEARKAYALDEVPVGAVIVCDGKIIARAHNLSERLTDATAHAEMQAFTSASSHLGGKYLNECTLYVTVEPCPMCAGASFWTQLGKIVYGASDEKRGFTVLNPEIIHPKTKIVSGILSVECSELMTEFFRAKRKKQ